VRLGVVCTLALLASGCASAETKRLRFVEHPYCSVVADGMLYRFHHDSGASASLVAAAARWPQKMVHLGSREPVEFECLRSVQRALERAGKTAAYAMDD
jgi:hypothetical protein